MARARPRPQGDHPDSSVRAWVLVTRYHLGTVAVGSLLITICAVRAPLPRIPYSPPPPTRPTRCMARPLQMLRALARRQARRDRQGPAAVFAACLYCLTACIDRCVRYISKHALIMVRGGGGASARAGHVNPPGR